MTCCDSFRVTQIQISGIQGPKGEDGKDGKDGITPSISVEAETLPEGSEAQVTKKGTDEAPLITFGIPKGDKGDTGSFTEDDVIDSSLIDNLFGE